MNQINQILISLIMTNTEKSLFEYICSLRDNIFVIPMPDYWTARLLEAQKIICITQHPIIIDVVNGNAKYSNCIATLNKNLPNEFLEFKIYWELTN